MEKLIKILNLTASDNDNEALAAIRKANELLKREKKEWKDVIRASEPSLGPQTNFWDSYAPADYSPWGSHKDIMEYLRRSQKRARQQSEEAARAEALRQEWYERQRMRDVEESLRRNGIDPKEFFKDKY